jgi:hypothetical protein
MSDDLCYFEFLRERLVKLREEYIREHNADTPEKKGKLLLHINAAFISSSVSSSIGSITF